MVSVRRVESEEGVADALAVREAVFVDEQGVSPDLERDDYDDQPGTDHFLASDEGRPVGAARLHPADDVDGGTGTPTDGDDAGTDDGDGDGDGDDPGRVHDPGEGTGSAAKAERVAVLPDHRGEGIGWRLMAAVEDRARERGFGVVTLHAQSHVESWYRTQGYETVGEPFEEAGIEHVAMRKRV